MVKINIINTQGSDAIQAAKNNRAEKADKSVSQASSRGKKASVSEDKIEFSSKGAEVGKLVDQLKQFPDVRQDRIDSLKQKIESGEYNPASDDIADAILKDEK